MQIAIILEGGLIQCVVAKEAMPDVKILVIDYDTEGVEPRDITLIRQGAAELIHLNLTHVPAVVSVLEVTKANIPIDEIFKAVQGEEK